MAEAGLRLHDAGLQEAARAWIRSHADFQPTQLFHVMPALAALAVARAGDPVGIELARRVKTLLDGWPRSEHGVYAESEETPVWVDHWYEIAPVLTTLARVCNDGSARAAAAEQGLAFIFSCSDTRKSLFHHAYYDRIHSMSQWAWARANGWAALAAVEMLDEFDDAVGVGPVLANVVRRHLARLVELQDASGLWHTVLDQPDTYCEASAWVMIALALNRAVKRGRIDGSYEAAADRGFDACLPLVDSTGNLASVSAETRPGDLAHYAQIPLGVYPRGEGFFVLAGLEWME